MDLVWHRAASADSRHADQEADLEAVGSPSGGARGFVAAEARGWLWAVLDR